LLTKNNIYHTQKSKDIVIVFVSISKNHTIPGRSSLGILYIPQIAIDKFILHLPAFILCKLSIQKVTYNTYMKKPGLYGQG